MLRVLGGASKHLRAPWVQGVWTSVPSCAWSDVHGACICGELLSCCESCGAGSSATRHSTLHSAIRSLLFEFGALGRGPPPGGPFIICVRGMAIIHAGGSILGIGIGLKPYRSFSCGPVHVDPLSLTYTIVLTYTISTLIICAARCASLSGVQLFAKWTVHFQSWTLSLRNRNGPCTPPNPPVGPKQNPPDPRTTLCTTHDRCQSTQPSQRRIFRFLFSLLSLIISTTRNCFSGFFQKTYCNTAPWHTLL